MPRSKTVTAKQIAANRANALASTGPRTPQGKARSRWNSLTHGVLAQAVILPALEPYESRQALEQLLAVLRDEFAPSSAVEEILVERIATSYWRLARVLRAEAAAIAERQESRQREAAAETALGTFYPLAPAQISPLARQVQRLSAVLNNKRGLRALMTEEDTHWREAEDSRLQEVAQVRLAELQGKLAEEQARTVARQQAACSLPQLPAALQFARYETTLERQLYRALDALERLQRLRAGEPVPPPLQMHLDVSVDPSAETDS